MTVKARNRNRSSSMPTPRKGLPSLYGKIETHSISLVHETAGNLIRSILYNVVEAALMFRYENVRRGNFKEQFTLKNAIFL